MLDVSTASPVGKKGKALVLYDRAFSQFQVIKDYIVFVIRVSDVGNDKKKSGDSYVITC
jgi:hypothetical protein